MKKALLLSLILLLTACHRDMYEQPKFLPDQKSYYFPQEQSDREPAPHSIPHGAVENNSELNTGMVNGVLVETFPIAITPGVVAEGREQFGIFCSACHGRDGFGQGMIVQRGFPQPPSYLGDRLRNAPVGHFFDVITNGYGAMYPFGSRISPADRWAIISYIRALQFSQKVPAEELEAVDRAELEKVP